MIATPVIDLLSGTATRQHRTGREHLVEQLPGRAGRPGTSPWSLTNQSCRRMKPSPPGLLGSSFGPAMNPSSDIDM
jgi:hypothetical protein